MKRNILLTALIAVTASLLTVMAYMHRAAPQQTILQVQHQDQTPGKAVLYTTDDQGEYIPLDFTTITDKVVEGVVHIKATQVAAAQSELEDIPEPFRDFFRNSPFGPRFEGPQARVGTGSGVIISKDGYILTNNHVVDGATDLEVLLHDNRTFKAKVVGTDPTTDLAVIQIKADDLPALEFADSDRAKVGEWVLAVGNPLGLNSTVTAGIISAKARNINILRDEQYAVESFLQTDAAINPGNSGGALVNLQGKVLGINSAIASPTGVYAGYGFAIPSNLALKVADDLIQYGVVQRGVLGVMIRTVTADLAREKDLSIVQGAYVDSLMENSAAEKGGIKKGDVIIRVGDNDIHTSSELQEVIARHRPGDVVQVTVNRYGKEKTFDITLNNRRGKPKLVEKEAETLFDILGIEAEAIPESLAKKLNIHGGIKITELRQGLIRQQTQMRKGFIITKVNGEEVNTPKELQKMLENHEGGVMLEGVYEDLPGVYYYAFGM